MKTLALILVFFGGAELLQGQDTIKLKAIENNIEIPSIDNFKAFINCNISPSICPMLWDELKDVDEGVKYCIYCEKSVYEVSSIKGV